MYTWTQNERIMALVVEALHLRHGCASQPDNTGAQDQGDEYPSRIAFLDGGAAPTFIVLTLTDNIDLNVGDANGEWGSSLSICGGMYSEMPPENERLEDCLNKLPYISDRDPSDYRSPDRLAEDIAVILSKMASNTQTVIDGLSKADRADLRAGDVSLETLTGGRK